MMKLEYNLEPRYDRTARQGVFEANGFRADNKAQILKYYYAEEG